MSLSNDYILTTTAITSPVKLSFTTYIKDVLTDSLLGGGINISTIDSLGVTEIMTIKDLIVQAKL